MLAISASVGTGGRNHLVDVRALQEAFNSLRPPHQSFLSRRLAIDGACGRQTLEAIARFQLQQFGWTDRLVERGGVTVAAINELLRDGDSPSAHRARAYARAALRTELRAYENEQRLGAPPEVAGSRRRDERDSPVGVLIANSEHGFVARASHPSGDVQVRRSGARNNIQVSGRLDFYPNDRVMTGVNGRVQLIYADGVSVMLPPETMVIFFNPRTTTRRPGLQAELETGALRSRLGELRGSSVSANL